MQAKRVLLVEDNEDNAIVYAAILEHHGCQVLLATNGEQGIRLAREARPDLVLMDMSMPILDGWTAARLLKRDPETAEIPIIALSAHAFDADRERARAAGCDSYLSKPCEPSKLLAEIDRWLNVSLPPTP